MSKATSGSEPIVYHKREGLDLQDKGKYTDWLLSLARAHTANVIRLHYYFCSDEEILEINNRFLKHDYYTDIITFPYGTDKQIEGEVFISTERVADNAASLNIDYEQELRRVMAHGVLHLLGFDDHVSEDIEEMRRLEEEALDMFHVKH